MTPLPLTLPRMAATLLVAGALGPAQAASYDETERGDLSSDRMKPTTWVLDTEQRADQRSAAGQSFSNLLSGTLGHRGNEEPDRDYLHIVVPKGTVLSAMILGPKTTVGSSRSFLGLVAGDTMPVAPDALDAKGLLGFWLYGKEDRETDLLEKMAPGFFGASGFETPLKAGDYTVWIQELAPGSFKYEFNLQLTAVPEPASVLMWSGGLAGLGLVGARRRRVAAA